ncbi:MAG: tRNA epoxyqueuosine(34) reductase QueG [Alphaproteobacteria bacterium]|nr:tRNA epoxyqueuosine(34) reductase QueG [Alphaproteobacteria bacterium]
MGGLAEDLKARARAEGFDDVRITALRDDPVRAGRLSEFLASNHHGSMEWMAETAPRRSSPLTLWSDARSAVVLAQSYAPDMDPMARLHDRDSGVISVYALNRDYHDVVKGKLKRLGQWLAHRSRAEVKVFVDTAPLMEKPLAADAGLGWQGKHTNLVSRKLGSWFFIGTILTAATLAPDPPEADHCGTCRACLDICPTQAFPAPYRLDARRCISYLTIEHRGHIDRGFRKAMGNRIYGCDDCLAVCPWNKFAQAASEAKLVARDELRAPALSRLLQLDDPAFRKLFSGSAVKRIGRDRFVRNVLIAAGNSGSEDLIADVAPLLSDAAPVVRAMAVWAISQLASPDAFARLRARHRSVESDPDVLLEWDAT